MAEIVLHTERLQLEKLEDHHFEELYSLTSNPEVQKYFRKTLNREESKEFLERIKTRQEKDGHSFWAVVRKSDLQFLGICGVLLQEVDEIKEFEVGYRINNKYWGKGYATEAALGCMTYAKETLQAKRIISLILPVNKSSIRVAEKNGLSIEKQAQFHGYTVDVYSKLL